MANGEPELTPELVVRGYCVGAFPMARGRHGRIDWYSPDPRAVLALEPGGFTVPRSLRKRVRSGRFEVTRDAAFERVIRACAGPRPHPKTGELPRSAAAGMWINDTIIDVYTRLHHAGLAHSVEAWAAGPERELVGGLYGVSLGGAFFGESMFSRASDASKVCLVHLVEHLRQRGFTLLDVQFVNPHLMQFGVTEIPRAVYLRRLEAALASEVRW